MTELQPICQSCDEKFVKWDEIVIFRGIAYHKDCLHEVPGVSSYFDKSLQQEFLGTGEDADFEGDAYEHFEGLEEEEAE
ncbi:hypothetical protein [Listeria rocourtiae]|uniref:hypothetical protein n=1 Tax=Listeria rocourtiae TaxID=647910 RepID=UPI003D2F8FF6